MPLALEFGIPGLASSFTPLKEVFESRCDIHESALHRTLGYLINPGKLVLFDLKKMCAQTQRRRFAACVEFLLLLSSRPVKGKPTRPNSPSIVVPFFRPRIHPHLFHFFPPSYPPLTL